MKKYWIVALSAIAMSLYGCSKENAQVGTLNLSLDAHVSGQDFVENATYTNASGEEYSLETFRFYLSDIALSKIDGGEELVEGTWFFDAGESQNTSSIDFPPGTYNGIRFHIGVPSEKNLGNPAVYEADEALSIRKGMHWSWSVGYIFLKMDGIIDSVGTSKGIIYHVGGNNLYKSMTLESESFTLEDGGSQNLSLELDISQVFEGIDMTSDNFTHSVAADERQQALSSKLLENFMETALTKKPF